MKMKQRDEAEERRRATASLPAFNNGKLSRTFLRGTMERIIAAVECKSDTLQPRFQNRDTEIHEPPEVWQMADPRRISWGIMTPDVTTPTGPKCTECSNLARTRRLDQPHDEGTCGRGRCNLWGLWPAVPRQD
jgi:hypothetical protein